MAAVARATRLDLETLLRVRKLDNTLTSALPSPGWFDEQVVIPTGIAVLDERLQGGVPRGQVSEIVGPRSSGRTSLLVAMLASATAGGEIAAFVDTLDMFDAASAEACGIDLGRLLWIRGEGCQGATGAKVPGCWYSAVDRALGVGRKVEEPGGSRGSRCGNQAGGVAERAIDGDNRQGVHKGGARGRRPGPVADAERWEQVLDRAIKALNLVLQAGGFGLVALDLAEVPSRSVRRLPFTTWLRLQRVIEGSKTACILLGAEPVARSAGGVTIALQRGEPEQGAGTQRPAISGRWSRLFLGLDVEARLSRARWPETTPCRFQFST